MPVAQTIQLDPAGGVPDVEIAFGQAQIGVYQCFLWDSSGNNSYPVAHGNNIDDLPDTFSIKQAPTTLAGRFISWQITIQTATDAPAQSYSVTIQVRQDGKLVPGGLFQKRGQFGTNSTALVVFGKFA